MKSDTTIANMKTLELKFPKGILYIIGNEAAERFSYYGMRSVLILFMTEYLLNNMGKPEFTHTEAVIWYHNFMSACYFFPLIGAIVSDVFWGKYKTIIFFSVIYCFGHLILASFNSSTGLFYGLALIAIGTGGIKPCVVSHVGDQFSKKTKQLLGKSYGWFYCAINCGTFASMLIIPYLLRRYNSAIAFGVPGILMLTAVIVFWRGRKFFITIPPIGWKKYKKEIFDKSNFKAICNLCIIFIFISAFYTLHDQYSSSWIIQAEKLNREINIGFAKFTLNQFQVQSVNPILILILTPIYSYKIYPFLERFTNLNYLKKIAAGLFITAFSFVIIAIIEIFLEHGKEVSILWQLLAFIFLTSGEILVSVTGLEIAYTHAPNSVKSLVLAFYLFAMSIGNFLTSIVNYIIQKWSGEQSIYNSTYFFIFAGFMGVVGIIFLIYMPFYKGRVYLQLLRTSLPKETHIHQSKIKKITDIILKCGKGKIAILIFYRPLLRKDIVKYVDPNGNVTYEYASDYDFLILTKDKAKYTSKLQGKIRDEFAKQKLETRTSFDQSYGVTLTIKSFSNFISKLEHEKYLFIKGRGILLYNYYDHKLLRYGQLEEAGDFKRIKKDCSYYHNNGLMFLRVAKLLINLPNYSALAIFNLHQATESFYHCALIALSEEKSYTHDLIELNRDLCGYSNKFYNIFPLDTKEQRKSFNCLQEAYSNARYNPNYSTDKEQIKYLISRIEKLEDLTKIYSEGQAAIEDI